MGSGGGVHREDTADDQTMDCILESHSTSAGGSRQEDRAGQI